MSLLEDEYFKGMPWSRFFNVSSDGPNINKALWQKLNDELLKKGYKGLLPFLPCTLHVVHNAFHKGIMCFGQDAQQLSVDLHSWFKASPCKLEDYKQIADTSDFEESPMFLRHVESRWLTLAKSLERIERMWPLIKKYFLTELPKQKELLRTLPTNKRYMRVVRAIRDLEGETLTQIKFILGVNNVFSEYLTIFQSDIPMIHALYPKMSQLLLSLIRRIVKADVIDSPKTNILDMNISEHSNHLALLEMDFGRDVSIHLNSIKTERERTNLRNEMKESLIQMASHLQKKLPFGSQILKDVTCLGMDNLDKETTTNAIGRLAVALPHLISEREVSMVMDEFLMLKNDLKSNTSFKKSMSIDRLDHQWADAFKKASNGQNTYKLLKKVIKSLCCLHNGNASVERSLSDNKNTVSSERTNLNIETLKGLRLSKEHARHSGGAHLINTLSKDMLSCARSAHSLYVERKAREEKERLLLIEKDKRAHIEAEAKEEKIKRAERSNAVLDEKENELEEEKTADANYAVADRLLQTASRNWEVAMGKGDMIIGVRLANELLQSARNKLALVTEHRTAARKKRSNLVRRVSVP